MRKVLMTGAAAGSLVMCLATSTIAQAEEVFKENFEGDVSVWKTSNYQNLLTLGVTDDGAFSTRKAYKISFQGSGGDTAWSLTSPSFPVKAGKKYILFIAAKNTHRMDKMYGTCFIWLDNEGKEISKTEIMGENPRGFDVSAYGSPKWRKRWNRGGDEVWHVCMTEALQAPENASSAKLCFAQDFPDFKPNTYIAIDEIRVREEQPRETLAEGFKEDFEGDLSGYKLGNYEFNVGLGLVPDGKDSQYCFSVRGAKGRKDTSFSITTPEFSVKGGKKYVVEFDSRQLVPLAGKVGEIEWLDGSGKEVSKSDIKGLGGINAKWHRIKVSVTAPSTAAQARLTLGFDVPNIQGAAFWQIDNLQARAE